MQLRKRWIFSLLTVATAAVATGQGAPRGIGSREVTLYARLLAMTDTRQLDTALINSALANKWRPLRAAATLAIGQVGAEHGMSGAARLRALLGDPDVTVGANAAYALGLLR